jgi:hypothetical protein
VSVCLLITTDGRPGLLAETLATFRRHVPRDRFTHCVVFDDSGDTPGLRHSPGDYGETRIIGGPERVGQDKAIAAAWRTIAELPVDWVFHLEDDFRFMTDVDLDAMISLLAENPYLAQVALLRQAWFARERHAGGLFAAHRDEYTQCTDPTGRQWVEHTRHWTFNPCLYPARLCRDGYIDGDRHELRYGRALCAADPTVRFAYWGTLQAPPAVWHLGEERAGHGY